MALVSVVIPFFDVDRYFRACLESVQRQTLGDLEVVLVDDGSSDGSRAIAEEFCAADPRFRLVSQTNSGPGPARNLGIEHAGGEFLAFVDADDLVHRRAYELLADSLQQTGADFAISRAARFSNLGVYPSMAQEGAIGGPAVRTHLTRTPELVLDRMIWNKVYRRSFWDAAGLVYEPILLQDYPVSLGAHVAAEAVDVLDEVLYYWRERDGGDLSVTQRNRELAHLTDRFTSANLVLDLAEPAAEASLPFLRQHLLEIDVHAFTAALVVLPEEDHRAALDFARRLLDRLGPDAAARSSTYYRVLVAMIEAGETALLLDLHRHARRFGRSAPIVKHGWPRGTWYEAFPGLRSGRLPDEPFAFADEPTVTAWLTEAVWAEDGFLDVRVLLEPQIPLGRRARAEVWLEDADGGRIPCPATLGPRARPFVGDDLVELHARIDPAVLHDDGKPRVGFHQFRMHLSAPGVETTVAVTGPGHGRGRYLGSHRIPGTVRGRVQPYRRPVEGFGLAVQGPWGVIDLLEADGPTLRLSGLVGTRAQDPAMVTGDEPARIVVAGADGRTVTVPLAVDLVDGGIRFTAEIDTTDLAEDPGYAGPLSVQTAYGVRAEVRGASRVLVVDEAVRAATTVVGHRSLAATLNGSGNLELVESRIVPTLDSILWAGPGTLRFGGIWRGTAPLPESVRLDHFEHAGERIELVAALDADGPRYAFDVDVAALVAAQLAQDDRFEGRDPAPWHLLLPFADHVATQAFDRTALHGFAEPRVVGGLRVEILLTRHDVVRIGIGG